MGMYSVPNRMIVDVPGEDEREKILKPHLRDETLEEGVTLAEIARKTVNHSGSDLKNLCVFAAMASVKEALGTFSWKVPKSKDEEKKGDEKQGDEKSDEKKDEKKDDEKKDDEQTMETEAAKERISKRIMKMSHFLQAMNEVPASSTSGSHSELRRWHEQFGKKSPIAATSKPSYGAGAIGDSAVASSSYASRYGSYAGGGVGAGSTPRYGGCGSGESGSTPRYGVNSGDSSTSATTPRYGSYAASGTGGSVTSTPRFGAAALSADSTKSTASATGDSPTPRYEPGATSGESVAAPYGSGGFSANFYLSGIGKNGSTSATGYTPGAGVSRFGAGSYKHGGGQSAGEKSSATIEQVPTPEQVVVLIVSNSRRMRPRT
ncbi:hypothetical protein BDQ17DRAFT_1358254 [Cyathus striatus]|nr:hypothetical protein BDQ17DRAFT_1358254 [Cyathus striatus]